MDYPTGVRPSRTGQSIEIRWRYKGQDYSETITKKPNQTNIRYAASVRKQRIDALKSGTYSNDHTNPLFGPLSQEYLDTAKLRPSTRKSYKELLNNYWQPLFGYPVNDITYNYLWQLDTGIKWPGAKTRNNAVTALRQVFKLAKRRGLCQSNPAADLEYEKHQKPEIDPYTATEKELILSNLKGQALSYFTLAFETGARTGELLALTWGDFTGHSIKINKSIVLREQEEKTKTAKGREVLLTERAIRALKSMPRPIKGGHIFTIEPFLGGIETKNIGQPHKDARWLNKRFKAAIEDSGVRYRRAYNCRHSYASLGLMAGAKPGFLANQLGHSLEMFFNRYAKWMESENDVEELRKLNQIGDKVGEKISGHP